MLVTLKNIYLAIIFLSFFTSFDALIAQTNATKVSGFLQGVENEPIPYCTVVLMDNDSNIIEGALSNDDGSFHITDISAGTYLIAIQNLEYEDFSTDVFELQNNEHKKLPPIIMQKSSVLIDEITVTGKRALVEVHPDKMVFNVASSPNAAGNTGLEILGKAPGVIIDLDNNIILQGKSGVRIFINGRPSRLSGDDLVSMLQSMQSDNIDHIEIITNPSSKYDAEGNAGIINIQLKTNLSLGYKGTLTSSYSMATYPRLSNGIAFSYGKGKINANININRFDNIFQDDFIDTKVQNGYTLDLNSKEKKKRSGFNLSSSLDYNISNKHVISLSANGIITDGDYELFSTTKISGLNNKEINEILDSKIFTDFKSNNFNYGLNYHWKTTPTSSINFDAGYGQYDLDKEILQPNIYFAPDGIKRLNEINNAYDPLTTIDLWSTKLDLEKKIKNIQLSTGVKYSYISTENDFVVSLITNGLKILDPDKSNDFTYLEKVMAGYAIADYKLSEKIDLNIGIRVENTSSEGKLISTQQSDDDNVIRNYTDYFPSISISYDNLTNSTINLSYGNRISRPNYQDLNPFESKISELVLWKGNPFLKPKYTTNYQVSYVFKETLVITNTFSITTDFFSNIVEIQDDKGAIIIPRNMQKSTTNGLSVSYPIELNRNWDVSTYFNYNRSTFKGEFESTDIDISADIYYARVQNNINLPGEIKMDLTAYWNSSFIWRGSIYVDGYYGINIGFKKKFLDDRLQIKLTGSDILNTNSDYTYYGNYGGIELKGVRSFDSHRFGISVSFKLGNDKIKSSRKKKGGLEDEMKRISN